MKTYKNKKKQLKNKTKKNKTVKRVYTKNDFKSDTGMLTSVWGPSMWLFLHTMSFNYPINPKPLDKKNYKNFILNLQYTLPCGHCRENFKKNLKSNPIQQCHMKNRDTFSRYIYNLHELVNRLLGKKSNLTYCEVRELYEHFRARCTKNKPKMFKFNKTKKKKEKGCTEPLYGKKAKCILKIVPHEERSKTFQVDKQCIKHKYKK